MNAIGILGGASPYVSYFIDRTGALCNNELTYVHLHSGDLAVESHTAIAGALLSTVGALACAAHVMWRMIAAFRVMLDVDLWYASEMMKALRYLFVSLSRRIW